jgi:16S rRNA (uracil1498-N3)-methyltransferase
VHRFFAPSFDPGDDTVGLPKEEAEHLVRVLRLGVGDTVAVFNGRGQECLARVTAVSRRDVRVQLASRVEPAAEPAVAITLVQAVLKGEKMDDVVRDAVMIGVAAIQPLLTGRTEISRATLQRGRRRERWERIAVSSAKQCGRAVVPRILDPRDFVTLPDAVARLQLPGPALMLVEPTASAETASIGELDSTPPKEVTIVIGPEGGWTQEEATAGASVCRLVKMGARTLRADAMAMIAIAALFAKWNEY